MPGGRPSLPGQVEELIGVLTSRERRKDPLLEWKVRILSVAIALALGGMYFEEGWMTGAALVLLFVTAAVRLAMGRRGGIFEDDDEDSVGDGDSFGSADRENEAEEGGGEPAHH